MCLSNTLCRNIILWLYLWSVYIGKDKQYAIWNRDKGSCISNGLYIWFSIVENKILKFWDCMQDESFEFISKAKFVRTWYSDEFSLLM